MPGAFRSGRGRAGFKNRNIFGASRYLPGNLGTSPIIFDTHAIPITPNTTTDIDISSITPKISGNGVSTGMPVAVCTQRAASAGVATSDGTLVVSMVHSDNSTTVLLTTGMAGGASGNNFHGVIHYGLTKTGDKAIRIVSATADASTVIFTRAAVWGKLQASAPTWTSVSGSQHTPITQGPFGTTAVGGAAFVYTDVWAGSSNKATSWLTPLGGASTIMTGQPWINNTFVVGTQSFPMLCNLTKGDPTNHYGFTGGNATDWIVAGATCGKQDWGQT